MTNEIKLQDNLEKYILQSHTKARVRDLLMSLFTEKERTEFAGRVEIIRRLKKGQSQHKIAKALGVGVATVTRGAREMKSQRFKFLQ